MYNTSFSFTWGLLYNSSFKLTLTEYRFRNERIRDEWIIIFCGSDKIKWPRNCYYILHRYGVKLVFLHRYFLPSSFIIFLNPDFKVWNSRIDEGNLISNIADDVLSIKSGHIRWDIFSVAKINVHPINAPNIIKVRLFLLIKEKKNIQSEVMVFYCFCYVMRLWKCEKNE